MSISGHDRTHQFGHLKPAGAGDVFVPEIVRTELENGLTVLVFPDSRSSAVTHMLWYRNGAIDDPVGKSGIAHFLEHLMFKGTPKYSATEFQSLIARVGGQYNAFTGWSSTCYLEQIPSEFLAQCMAFEADRMKNLVFDKAEVDSERDVVLAERGMMVDADPSRALDESLLEACYPSAAQGRPVIGWRSEIEGLLLEDAAAYYKRFYTPENAILVVAGDVGAEATIELARQFYGAVPRGTPPPPRALTEPAPGKAQRIVRASPAVRQPEVRKLLRVPAPERLGPPLAYALDLVGFHLAGHDAAHLKQKLVFEQRLALDVGAHYWFSQFPHSTVFYFKAIPAPGTHPDVLDKALEDALRAFIRDGMSEADLARCKRQIEARSTFAFDDQFVVAHHFGEQLSLGRNLDDLMNWQGILRSLSIEDIKQTLALLDLDTAVTGFLVAEPPSNAPTA